MSKIYHENSVLLVDDDTDLRGGLSSLLSQSIDHVFVAGSGTEALQFLDQNEVDAVLTDKAMPSMDGITLIEQIQKTSPQIITLVITAYGEKEDAQRAIQAGAFDFIDKPFEPQIVCARTKNAVKMSILRKLHSEIIELMFEQYGKSLNNKPSSQSISDQIVACKQMLGIFRMRIARGA